MYARCEIKKQRFKCWSDQFITNVNKARVVVRDQPLSCGEGSDGREPLKSVVVSDKPLPLPWLW